MLHWQWAVATVDPHSSSLSSVFVVVFVWRLFDGAGFISFCFSSRGAFIQKE